MISGETIQKCRRMSVGIKTVITYVGREKRSNLGVDAT